MTGRDLIVYILENHLEDEPIFKDGKIIGFMTEEEAALAFGVGVACVQTWAKLGIIFSVQVGNKYYIPIKSRPRIV